jgi:outer membrane protein OmpA-like peptidoglycan-associated protein
MPVSAQKGGSFTPTYSTSGDGNIFSVVSTWLSVCIVSGTQVDFIGTEVCSRMATAAATNDFNSASSTSTALSSSASKPPVSHNLGIVYFAPGQNGVSTLKSRNTIERAARLIAALHYLVVTVTAYTHKSGSNDGNASLISKRAANVIALLKADQVALKYSKAALRGIGKGVSNSSSIAALDRIAIITAP